MEGMGRLGTKGKSRQESRRLYPMCAGKFLRELTFTQYLLYATPCERHLSKDPISSPELSSEVGIIILFISFYRCRKAATFPRSQILLSCKVRTWTHICLLSKSLLFLFPMLLSTPSLGWTVALASLPTDRREDRYSGSVAEWFWTEEGVKQERRHVKEAPNTPTSFVYTGCSFGNCS